MNASFVSRKACIFAMILALGLANQSPAYSQSPESTRIGADDGTGAPEQTAAVSSSDSSTSTAPAAKTVGITTETAKATGALPAVSNPPSVLTKATISASGDLDLVTTTLFAGAIRVFDKFPGVTLYASAASTNNSTQTSTKYSDVQFLIPEGATLGLYLSPFSQNPFSLKTKIDSNSDSAFGDRRQVVDRYYFASAKEGGTMISTENAANRIDKIDDPVTLVYLRDGIGAKMFDRSQDPQSSSATSTSASSQSSTTDYGLGASAYLGIGIDGGLLAMANGKSSTAGVFRLESLLTATWADRQTVQALYPNPASKLQDAFCGIDSRFSLSINSNVKASLEYALPILGSRSHAGKAVLLGVTISQ